MSQENKKVAIAFYEKALNDRDVETAFGLYAGKHYRQHNPLVETAKREFASSPSALATIIRMRMAKSSARLQTAISSFCTAIGSA